MEKSKIWKFIAELLRLLAAMAAGIGGSQIL